MKKYFLLTAGMLLLYPLLFGQTVPATDSPLVAVRLIDEPRWYLTVHSGYAVALGSTFQFYPDNITSIVVTAPATGSPTKAVTYQAQTRGRQSQSADRHRYPAFPINLCWVAAGNGLSVLITKNLNDYEEILRISFYA